MARAIATRCCSPPLSSMGNAFVLWERPTMASDSLAAILARLDLAGAAARAFDDVDSIDQRLRHRVNTMAGSIRMTCAMAAMADATHMTMVNTSSPTVNAGVTTIGNADSAVILTTMAPIAA